MSAIQHAESSLTVSEEKNRESRLSDKEQASIDKRDSILKEEELSNRREKEGVLAFGIFKLSKNKDR